MRRPGVSTLGLFTFLFGQVLSPLDDQEVVVLVGDYVLEENWS